MSGLHWKHHNHHNDTLVITPGNPHEEIWVGKEFIGVIVRIFPGGYLLTIRLGNGVTLRGSMLTSDQPSMTQGDVNVNVPLVPTNVSLTQNTRNLEARIDLNSKKETHEFEVDDYFSSDYSYLEISPSHEIQMSDLLLYSEKFESIVFKLFNPTRGVPINQTISSNKGSGVYIDLIQLQLRKVTESTEILFFPGILHPQQ